MQQITSRKNPLVLHMKKLAADSAYRRDCGEFVCDGEKLLREAIGAGTEIRTVLTCTELSGLPQNAELIQTTEEIIESISVLRSARDVVFTCRLPEPADRVTESGKYVLLDGVQDPGNLGTVARSANAFGFDGLILCGSCADPYSPKVARACMGALFRLPVYRLSYDALRDFAESGGSIWGTFPAGEAEDIRNVRLEKGIVVIGSEGSGISEEIKSLCTKKITIPMRPGCESLNAAAAAAVLMWEILGRFI